MARLHMTFRKYCRVSELCAVFDAVLAPNHEEGIARHFVHQLPVQVVLGAKGNLETITDRYFAVVMGLTRDTELEPYMEEDLRLLSYRPAESLYLPLPVGDPVFKARTRLLDEASKLFIDLAEAGTPVKVVAISHRRQINGSIVIRHYPVALFDHAGSLLWAHPAGNAYGLIRYGFPLTQKVRILGPKTRTGKCPEMLRRLDDETGLPAWYQFAREHLQELQTGEEPLYRAVMDHQAYLWVQRSIVETAEQALIEATQQFLIGFETFFGQGGLYPTPGRLDLA